jgi:hypothetical protein
MRTQNNRKAKPRDGPRLTRRGVNIERAVASERRRTAWRVALDQDFRRLAEEQEQQRRSDWLLNDLCNLLIGETPEPPPSTIPPGTVSTAAANIMEASNDEAQDRIRRQA